MNWFTKFMKVPFRGLGSFAPKCREVTRLQSEALERRLPFRQRLGLRVHLLVCKWCRRYGRQIIFLRSAARDHDHDEQHSPPVALSAEARARIKRALQSGKE